MSSSSDEYQMLLILDKDPSNSKYRCPLTTCGYVCSSMVSILAHMWKFKANNSVNKTCTGQTSPSLTLYPKLFEHSKFCNNTFPVLSAEYPDIDWRNIQKYMRPSDESAPKIVKLIKEFDIFLTTAYLDYFPCVKIPKCLQLFILNPDFNPSELASLLYSIKHSVHEPPLKKRKLANNLCLEQQATTLSLPSLNILSPNTPKSEEEFIPNYDTLSCTNIISHKVKKRRGIGPICSACKSELNPCDVMIQCTECEHDGHKVIVCILCFKSGIEFDSHKRFHRYNVLRPLPDLKLQRDDNEVEKRYKLSHARWCGNNEWNLLFGLRLFGLANWSQITKIINKNSPLHKHYECKYIEQQFYNKYGEKVFLDTKEENVETDKYTTKTHTKRSENNKFTDKHQRKCGYREMRDEFEAEWNNNAEAMIGDMYFSPYDTEKERALKLEGIRIYNDVLKEREIRKQFIKHYGVICRNRNKRNMSDEDIEIEQKISDNLAVFARFTKDKSHNFAEFRALIQGLLDEYRLREKIYKIRHYLLNGVTSVSQMETIEKYMNKQEELKANREEEDAYDEDEDEDVIAARCADEYLNRYHGCSLDAISTYLKLIESEQKKKRDNKPYAYSASDFDVSVKDWNVNKMEKAHVLNEGEKKLCNVLKITPKDYQHIQQQVTKRVEMHGLQLINNDKAPKQLYIDIEDNKNVKESMQMRIGLVDHASLIIDK